MTTNPSTGLPEELEKKCRKLCSGCRKGETSTNSYENGEHWEYSYGKWTPYMRCAASVLREGK